MEDYKVVETMRQYGGSFIRAFAELYRLADLQNQRILREAFPKYWMEYAEMTRQIERNREKGKDDLP